MLAQAAPVQEATVALMFPIKRDRRVFGTLGKHHHSGMETISVLLLLFLFVYVGWISCPLCNSRIVIWTLTCHQSHCQQSGEQNGLLTGGAVPRLVLVVVQSCDLTVSRTAAPDSGLISGH